MRDHVTDKSLDMRRQGFVGAAMLPMAELEYTGIVDKLKALDSRFVVRSNGKTESRPRPMAAATLT